MFIVLTNDAHRGSLYGVDLDADAGTLEIGMSAEIGGGSGSSPSLSPDGTAVYTNDAAGFTYSIDTQTGSVNWKVDTGAEAGANSIGPDGKIWALVRGAGYRALDPATGTQLFATQNPAPLSGLTTLPGFGAPTGLGSSSLILTRDSAYAPVAYGYNADVEVAPGVLVSLDVIVQTEIVEFDPTDGSVRGILATVPGMAGVLTTGLRTLQGLTLERGSRKTHPEQTRLIYQSSAIQSTILAPLKPQLDAAFAQAAAAIGIEAPAVIEPVGGMFMLEPTRR